MTYPRAAALVLAGVATLFLLGVVLTPLWPQVAIAQGVAEDQDVAPSGRRLLSGRRLNLFSPDYLPSLYLNYQNPSPQESRSWFSSIDVTDSTKATFFSVQRTQFGYFGIQQTLTYAGKVYDWFGMENTASAIAQPYYGLVIFSAWNIDAGKCQVESVGDGAYQDKFAGEGTGCQIMLDTAWGNEHNCFVTTATRTSGRIMLAGYWHKGAEPWRLVGSISVPDVGQQFGKGGIAAFLEQYYSSIDQDDHRMANFGPQYVETAQGQWVPVETAKFEATDSSKEAYYVGRVTPDGSQFMLCLAGHSVSSISSNTPPGTTLTLRAAPPPSSSAELQSWIALRSTSALPQGCGGQVTSCATTNAATITALGKESALPDGLGGRLLALLGVADIAFLAVMLFMWCRS